MKYGEGQWKEGRSGAASLCYIGLDPETLSWVLQHHSEVGIRATLAGQACCEHRRCAADRNWDLACLDADDAADLHAIDGRRVRGVIHCRKSPTAGVGGTWLYQVTRRAGEIAAPREISPQALPAHVVGVKEDTFLTRIAAIASAGGWAIWRFEQMTLSAMGPEGHGTLLSWLGQEHANIWCAPVRDVAEWRP